LKLCFFCKICDITYCQCYLHYCEKDHEAFFQQMQQQSTFLHKLQQGICCEQKNTMVLCFSNNLQQEIHCETKNAIK
jgi:hypothetical protein